VRGSIRANGASGWQVRISLGRDPETKEYRYLYRQVQGGKRDAQRVAAELIAEVERGGHRHPRRYTVAELLDRWMAHIETQSRAPSTLVRYRSAIGADILPRLGAARIDRLGPADIDAFYARLNKAGLSPLSIRKCHAILSAALNQAIKWGWIDRNPVDRASPPGVHRREIRPPTPQELRALLQSCMESHPDLASLLYVAATTGCRRGELCGLRWQDLDVRMATLVVARSISDAGREVSVKGTKTHQARRIALDASTVNVLSNHRQLAETQARAAGVVVSDAAYVWSQDLDGTTPYRPDRVTGAFRTLRDNLGLKHITFHALRHYAATTLANRGVGVRTIAGRLGHANPSVTLRTFAHFLDAADREAANAIGRVVAGLAELDRYPDSSARRSNAFSSARRGTTKRRPNRSAGSSP
jgi:integrase